MGGLFECLRGERVWDMKEEMKITRVNSCKYCKYFVSEMGDNDYIYEREWESPLSLVVGWERTITYLIYIGFILYKYVEFKNITISVELIETLKNMKVHPRQSYGEVIENLIKKKKWFRHIRYGMSKISVMNSG